MFGQPSTTTSPFATPSATPFGAAPTTTPAVGGFGSPAPSAFGTPAQPQQPATSGFGGFGSPAAAPVGSTTGFGGFGSTATTGAATTGFGGFGSPQPQQQPAAPASTPFGGGGGGLFGGGTAAPATGGLFGSSTPAASGFGGFGAAPKPATQPPAAGGFGINAAPATTFGAPVGGGLFGGGTTAAPSTGLFGGGATQPASAGSIFGGAATTTTSSGGLFGAATTQTTAAPNNGVSVGTSAHAYQPTRKTDGTQGQQIYIQSIVGMPAYEGKSVEELRMEDYMAGNRGTQGGNASNTGAFGAVSSPTSAPTTGLFGSSSPNTSTTTAFGAAPSTGFGGGFGATPVPAPSTGMFGAPPAAAPVGGGLFGTAAPSPLFGGGTTTAAPATAGGSLFGTTAPAAPSSGGLFGTANTSTFAAASSPAPTTSIFGAPPAAPGNSLFTAPAPATSNGLFSAPATSGSSIFGTTPAAPPPTTSGIFGTTNPTPAPSTSSLFGTQTPAPSGLFGAPTASQPTTGLFGSTTTSAFGSPTPSFSAPQQAAPTPAAAAPFAGGLFSSVTPTTPAAAQQPLAAWSSCGAQQMVPPTADVLLAQQMAAVEQQKKELAVLEAWRGGGSGGVENGSSGSSVRPASVFERDVFGGARRSGSDGMESNGTRRLASSPSSPLMRYPPAPRSSAKIRPRGFAPVRSPSTTGSGTMTIGGGRRTPGRSPMMSPNRFLSSSAKHLVIKPGALTPKPKMRLLLTNDDYSAKPQEDDNTVEKQRSASSVASGGAVENSTNTVMMSPHLRSPTMIQPGEKIEHEINELSTKAIRSSNKEQELKSVGVQTPNTLNTASPPLTKNKALTSPTSLSPSKEKGPTVKGTTTSNGEGYEYYRMVVGSPESVVNNIKNRNESDKSNGNEIRNNIENEKVNDTENDRLSNPVIPKLTKLGYTITPSLNSLSFMSEADLAAVEGFKVERTGFGSIAWDGAVDVRRCNLDSVVSIETKTVAVYDNEAADATKPVVGSKLNRPAVITIHNIFPKAGGMNASMEVKAKYAKKIANVTKDMDADLLSYNASDGIWKFRVQHFSRYGLHDDDDDDDDDHNDNAEKENDADNAVDKINTGNSKVKSSTKRGTSVLRTGGQLGELVRESNSLITKKSLKTGRFSASFVDDETISEGTVEEESVALMSDGDDQVIEAAENAYEKITYSLQSGKLSSTSYNSTDVQYRDIYYRDEGYLSSEYAPPEIPLSPLPSTGLNNCATIGISAIIAQKSGVKTATTSCTDFGMRMGRSFRVGWRPDGSIIHPISFSKSHCNQSKILVQSRPALIDETLRHSVKKDNLCTKLLSVHLTHCEKLAITEEDTCPFFSLHPITSMCDAKAEHNERPFILDGYIEEMNAKVFTDTENGLLVAQVLSLTSILFKATPDKVNDNYWRKETFTKWLQKICSRDVEREIAVANSQNDSLAAIFAALSGNDIRKAEAISSENGLCMLSTLLTNLEQEACSDLMQQVEAWEKNGASGFCPTMLLRILALLSGNLDLEEAVYGDATSTDLGNGFVLDWKRRLGMLLRSKDGYPMQSAESEISSLVLQYESDVSNGLAPPPSAWYCDSRWPNYEKCILYRLLELFANDGNSSLVNMIVPFGHTSHQHDVSKSFHFASALAALRVCQPLTRVQESKLLEGYAFQLLEANLWEWAVYVLLCTFTDVDSIDEDLVKQRKLMAQDIILRHYHINDHDVDPSLNKHQLKRRSFLEQDVGIPSSWFEMALSYRFVREFDQHGFVRQIAHFSLVDALPMCEETLPDIIMDGRQTTEYEGVMNFLSAFKSDCSNAWDDSCLARFVYDFWALSQSVNDIFTDKDTDGKKNIEVSKQRIDNLILEAEQLQKNLLQSTIVTTNTKKAMHLTSQFFSSMAITSREMCLTELRSAVTAMILHLHVFRMGGSPFETTGTCQRPKRKLKRTSELMFAWSNQLRDESSTLNVKGVLESSTILRGIHGLTLTL